MGKQHNLNNPEAELLTLCSCRGGLQGLSFKITLGSDSELDMREFIDCQYLCVCAWVSVALVFFGSQIRALTSI